MSAKSRWAGMLGAAILGLLCLTAERADGQVRPRGVSDSSIALGRSLYLGKGDCAKCHGANGEGTAEGISLNAGAWKVGTGSYQGILHVVRHSGIAARGRDGDPMPMRGPTLLSAEEVKAVACYVWSISRAKVAPPKE